MESINKAKELLNEITDNTNSDPGKLELLLPYLDKWIDTMQNIKELDLSLQEGLKTSLGKESKHVIMTNDEFQNELNKIGEDSLIIYIKKAQVYKVYNPDSNGNTDSMYNDFVDDDNTKYRTKRTGNNGNVYEVVRDTHPQRLLITIVEDVNAEKIEHIKKLILEFVKKHTKFSETNMGNLKVYGNDKNTEFLVSNIHFGNIVERDEFMEDFIKYMRESKGDSIADKIQVRPPLGSIKGTRLYKVASQKEQKDSSIVINSLEHLITYIKSKGAANVVINGPVTIVNGNNNNVTVKANTTVKKTIKTFCRHLYDTNPEWYKENEYVDFALIEDAYREYFADNTTETYAISKMLNGILFNGSTRKMDAGKRKTMKKLVKKEKLKGDKK